MKNCMVMGREGWRCGCNIDQTIATIVNECMHGMKMQVVHLLEAQVFWSV